jgi:DNA-binding transcriptional ArsR family regulator
MGWWKVSADTLAASRFVISPLAETTASLITLHQGTAAHPADRTWLDAHRPAYRERLAGDPVTAVAVRAALGQRWIADFLAPAPLGEGERPFSEELAPIRDTPRERVLADLEISLGGQVPAPLRRPDLAPRLADLLQWVWADCVLPYWPRRRRIIEADILARSARLSYGGWTAALDGLRPGIRWLGNGRLQINAHNYLPQDISAAQLMFVPITTGRGCVSWNKPHRYALTYPCAGVLAEARHAPVPAPLTALLGPGRARILILLDTPKSTTQLVALTGLGLGSVGRHLKILLDARLIQRRRAGRSVVYSRTQPGDTLANAQPASLWTECPRRMPTAPARRPRCGCCSAWSGRMKAARPSTGRRTGTCQNRCTASARSWKVPAPIPAALPATTCGCRRWRARRTRPGSTTCWILSGSPATPAAGSASSPSACGSA